MKKILALATLVLFSSLLVAQPGGNRYGNQPRPAANQNVSLKVRAFLSEKFIVTVDGRRQEGYASRSYTFSNLRPGRHDLTVELTSPARATHRATVNLQSQDEEYVVQWKSSRNGTELVVEPLDVFLYGQGNTGRIHTSQPPSSINAPNRTGSYRDGYQDGYRDGWRDAINSMMMPPVDIVDPYAVAIEEIPVATPEEVSRMVSQLKSESFDDNRSELAQAMVVSKMLSTADIKRLMATFTFEDNKLDFAKFAYPYVADPQNYFQVASGFTFSSNKTDLLNYIKNNPR